MSRSARKPGEGLPSATVVVVSYFKMRQFDCENSKKMTNIGRTSRPKTRKLKEPVHPSTSLYNFSRLLSPFSFHSFLVADLYSLSVVLYLHHLDSTVLDGDRDLAGASIEAVLQHLLEGVGRPDDNLAGRDAGHNGGRQRADRAGTRARVRRRLAIRIHQLLWLNHPEESWTRDELWTACTRARALLLLLPCLPNRYSSMQYMAFDCTSFRFVSFRFSRPRSSPTPPRRPL